MTLDAWRRHAARFLADAPAANENDAWPEAGIVAVRSDDSYLHGLFCYRIIDDLRAGPTVCAQDFVALGLFQRAEMISTLVAALESIAASHGCAHMHVHVPKARVVPMPSRDAPPRDTESSVLKALQAHGFHCTSVRLER